MKKYAIVDTEKSTRIFTSALTWFFLRTVPSSRNANPPCIASTITAPMRMNNASLPFFRFSMAPWLDVVRDGKNRTTRSTVCSIVVRIARHHDPIACPISRLHEPKVAALDAVAPRPAHHGQPKSGGLGASARTISVPGSVRRSVLADELPLAVDQRS